MSISTLLFRDINELEFNKRWGNVHYTRSFNTISHDAKDSTIRFPYQMKGNDNIKTYKNIILRYEDFINRISLERSEYIDGSVTYSFLDVTIDEIKNCEKIHEKLLLQQNCTKTYRWNVCIYMRKANYDEYLICRNLSSNILKW